MPMTREPVSPETCTVLGYRIRKRNVTMWTGLDLSRAEFRQTASIMDWVCGGVGKGPPDPHLRVPWKHPADPPPDEDDEMWYRVRPRRKRGFIGFERDMHGAWWIVRAATAGKVDSTAARSGTFPTEDVR